MKKIFLFLYTSYKYLIDPLLINSCRFSPTCSIYFRDAIIKYNTLFALFLIIERLLKCNKFFIGGYKSII